MAESRKKCVACGQSLAMFSELTVNRAAYHIQYWIRGRPVRKVPTDSHNAS